MGLRRADQVPPPPPLVAMRIRVTPSEIAGSGPARQYPILGYWQDPRSAWRVDKSIHSAEYRRLCALLRQLRLEAGLTQVEVAERLDEPQSFVSKYETGERRLDMIELHYVAEAIGVPMGTLLKLFAPIWFEGAK